MVRDPDNARFYLAVADGGVVVPGQPYIVLDLNDAVLKQQPPAGALTKSASDVKLRRVHYVDAAPDDLLGNPGQAKIVLALCSGPSPEVPDDTEDTNNDIWVGGGGARKLQLDFDQNGPSQIPAVFGSYLRCVDPNDLGGPKVYVAKPHLLRATVASRKYKDANGTQHTVTYTYPPDPAPGNPLAAPVDSRTSEVDGNPLLLQAQVINDRYLAGDEVCAVPYSSGVTTIDGQAVGYLDMNPDGRRWLRTYGQ